MVGHLTTTMEVALTTTMEATIPITMEITITDTIMATATVMDITLQLCYLAHQKAGSLVSIFLAVFLLSKLLFSQFTWLKRESIKVHDYQPIYYKTLLINNFIIVNPY